MTTQAADVPAVSQIHHLRFARSATKRLLDGFPQDKLCTQTESCRNHALWIVGHLVVSDDFFLAEFSKGTMATPEEWNTMFGMGSTPSPDAMGYPSLEDLTKALDDRHEAMIAWLETLTPEQLAQPIDEKWAKYAPTLGDVAAFQAWHEGYHAGQLSTLRRAFGLDPAFG